jgi:hypothetical protein
VCLSECNGKVLAVPTLVPGRLGFDVMDATRARSSLIDHSYFADDPELMEDVALLLRQHLSPDQRSITLDSVPPIWVFRP